MSMRVVIAAVVALTVSAAAVAAPPAGFVEATTLEPAASFVAGKPVAVNCATTHDAWTAYVASVGVVGDANGITVVGSSEVALSDVVCRYLRAGAKGQAPFQFAASIEGLVHESIHARGESDEGVTDCAAMHEMPRVAVRFFHVKRGRPLSALMADAWKFHRRQPPPYQTVC